MSQSARLLAVLKDHRWHSTLEILDRVYGGEHLGLARVGARIYELRQRGYEIEGRKDEKNRAIYHYRLVEKEPATMPITFKI